MTHPRIKAFKVWIDWEQVEEAELDITPPSTEDAYIVFGYRYKEDAIKKFVACGLADYEFDECVPGLFSPYLRCEEIDLYKKQCIGAWGGFHRRE